LNGDISESVDIYDARPASIFASAKTFAYDAFQYRVVFGSGVVARLGEETGRLGISGIKD
jgi:hypothetical protein